MMRENVLGADNQQERPAVRIWRAKREVRERARLQSCRQSGKISRALAPGVLLLCSAGILRDCMPDSNSHWKRYSPNCMATCREWQKCPLHFPIINDVGKSVHSAAKAEIEGTSNGTTVSRALPKTIDGQRRRNKVERNSLSGKFRPARMA